MVGVVSRWALHGYCYFCVRSAWLLLHLRGLCMVPVTSEWALHLCCYFQVGYGWLLLFPGGLWMVVVNSGWAPEGGHNVRCARAVPRVGCFPPPVAMGPRVLNSAPYSPCWYTRVCFFLSLILAMGPRVLNSAPHAVLN